MNDEGFQQNSIDPDHFRVAIFGSARIKPNDPRYNQIYQLAKHIAGKEYDIVTGGGPGLMEAANKGHQEGRQNGSKIHSFGLNIMLPREQHANRHLDIKEDFRLFSQRLDQFMRLSNVVVVAPGGIGTLLELFYTWQLIQVEHICNIPVILLGEQWPELLEWMKKWPLRRRMVDKKDFDHVFLANNCAKAMKIINVTYREYKKGDKDFCVNWKKYKID